MPYEGDLINNIKSQLETKGEARIRTGDRRSVTKARKLAKEAADALELSVKRTDEDGYLLVVVK